MKRIFTIILIAVCITATGQTSLTEIDYLKKSKRQKTGAWLLVGAGTGMILTGSAFVYFADALSFYDDDGLRDFGLGMIGGGVLVSSASIPLFIAAAKNKKTAMDISAVIKLEESMYIHQLQPGKISIPAIGIRLNISR